MSEIVAASPSKNFFVRMLTRDISLEDAILDLLDNCIDGILRQLSPASNNGSAETGPYEGYWAKITATPEKFVIEDNCGGIPRNIAIKSAFMLGRPDLERDQDIATVGMYGIGMKRALFKMGRNSKVESQHEGDAYVVKIPSEWLDDDLNWNLELNDLEDGLETDGTSITVTDLYPNIARQFNQSNHNFLKDLETGIGDLFALIIKKGFTVYLNGNEVTPAPLDILFAVDSEQADILPYAYKALVDNVNIEIVVGFYRELAKESEIEDEQLIPRKTDNAGWTVICNDRVVLHRDKTHITGWGVPPVPKYHTQFIAIAGVARFTSNDSLQLPLNTTKRGLDTSSNVYWNAQRRMREGLKKFTDFTNHWKGREEETTASFAKMAPTAPQEIVKSIPQSSWRTVRDSDGNEERFAPELPRPPREDVKRRITFLRLKDEIELLGEFFFDDPEAHPSDIGNRCFDDALKLALEE
jgi:hypothetical protein